MDKNNLYRNILTGQSDLESMYHYQSINLKTLANRIAARCGVSVSHCDVLEGQVWFVNAKGQTEEKKRFRLRDFETEADMEGAVLEWVHTK